MSVHGKRALAVLITGIMALACALPAFALEDVDTRTVRVGYYHIEGYNVMDETGAKSGYGYEVLQAMKLYVNWDYEYIGYDLGWTDIQQMLADGRIDMVISAVKTPEREEKYDFSDRSVSQSGACLMVKAGESPYVAGQYETYNGMRVGFIENASQIEKMRAFAEEKGFSYTPVTYKTSNELEAAVLDGKDVDAIVTSNMRIVSGTRRLELFAMQDVHAMVKKGNSELLAEINFALEQISLYNPGLYDSLYKKYYSTDAGDAVFFSPEETELIAQLVSSGDVLRMALLPRTSPYAYFENGEPKGILYDIAAEIIRRTGLPAEIVVTENTAEYRALERSGGADIFLATVFDYNGAERLGYTLADPYYTANISRVTRKGDAHDADVIAVVQDSAIETDYLPTIVTDEQVVRFTTVDACVQALMQGTCDALYLYTGTAQEVVYNDETNRLSGTVMPRFDVRFSVGVREDADARLAAIIEKATVSLSESDVAEIELRYTDYQKREMTLKGLLYSNPLLVLALFTLLLVLLFACAFLFFIARKRALEREKNRQLQQALSAAEKANAAKSTFLSRMSHEIRTPLNAIIGYNAISVSTLSDAKDATAYRQAAMKAMDCLSKSDLASKHLLTVINDVLDMSAIESGKIKIAQEPFDFKGALSALTVLFFSNAKAKGVEFEVAFDRPTEEWFVGDQMRLSQILTNLLSNAVKFTPAGGSIRLTVRTAEQTPEQARIEFVVRDTGIGMSPDFLSEIWTPFEQADASISRRFGGTGLGLSITKNLVDLMGGSITVESEQDKGSTFTVILPLGRMEQTQKEPAYDFSAISVLVADDDKSTCDYLKLLFSRYDVRCTAVNTGTDAVRAVSDGIERKDPFTVCIVDWRMPELSGQETVRRIREVAGAKLPIFVISAYNYSEIEPEAKSVGADTFLAKPLFRSTVFDLLVSVTGRNAAAAFAARKTFDFGGARILLAEDHKMNMEIAKAILSSWNLIVDSAWNGREAVEMFLSSPAGTYRAILMDVHMPEMDGYRATKTIRASEHLEANTVPIIAMTADVFAEDVSQALSAGMNDHVGKPIDRKLLFSTLRKYIDPETQEETCAPHS